jgi:hypothetical protein
MKSSPSGPKADGNLGAPVDLREGRWTGATDKGLIRIEGQWILQPWVNSAFLSRVILSIARDTGTFIIKTFDTVLRLENFQPGKSNPLL